MVSLSAVEVEEGCDVSCPLAPGVFDVVMIVGALRPGFVPVSVIRELCLAAKPGNQHAAPTEGHVTVSHSCRSLGFWTSLTSTQLHCLGRIRQGS